MNKKTIDRNDISQSDKLTNIESAGIANLVENPSLSTKVNH